MTRTLVAAALALLLPLQASALTVWERIDLTYEERSEDTVLPIRDQMQAAEAARHLGKSFDRYQRLMIVTALTDNLLAQSLMSEMERTQGFVDVSPKTQLDVQRLQIKPQFELEDEDQRKAVRYAQSVLDMGYGFRGMLPVGTYKVGRSQLVVEPGKEFIELKAVAARGWRKPITFE